MAFSINERCARTDKIHAIGVVNDPTRKQGPFRQNDVVVRTAQQLRAAADLFDNNQDLASLAMGPASEIVSAFDGLIMRGKTTKSKEGREEVERSRTRLFRGDFSQFPSIAIPSIYLHTAETPSGAVRLVPENSGVDRQEYLKRIVLHFFVQECMQNTGRYWHLDRTLSQDPLLKKVLWFFLCMLQDVGLGIDRLVAHLGVNTSENAITVYDQALHRMITALESEGPQAIFDPSDSALFASLKTYDQYLPILQEFLLAGMAPERERLCVERAKHLGTLTCSDGSREEREAGADETLNTLGISTEPTSDLLRSTFSSKMRRVIMR